MHCDQYLADRYVSEFIEWLSADVFLHHHYRMRKSGQDCYFKNLADAFQQYLWPFHIRKSFANPLTGQRYEDNTRVLNILRDELKSALTHKDENSLALASDAVFEWGGVRHGNRAWALEKAQANSLVEEYFQGMRMLELRSADDRLPEFSDMRFNAGLTKIYSLLVDGFVIYDSRVAAALGWLVTRYCEDRKLKATPEMLAFPWMSGKEGSGAAFPKRRDPSTGSYRFPPMGQDARRHASWNLRASWLLNEVARRLQPFKELPDGGRALEAALFMIGYDLGYSQNSSGTERLAVSRPASTTIPGIGCETLSTKKVEFSWRLTDDAIVIMRPDSILKEVEVKLEVLTSALRDLAEKYKDMEWTLDNNVADVANSSTTPGFGRMLYRHSKSTIIAQTASHLGPVLMKTGLLIWNGRQRGIAFHFRDSEEASNLTPEALWKAFDAIRREQKPLD